jgi:hypothetical protein
MHKKITERTLPPLAAVEAEVARVEAMIAATTRRLESPTCSLRTAMHLQVCRAELQAYLAGLSYALGYTDLVDTRQVHSQLPNIAGIEDPLFPTLEDEKELQLRYVQCYEC